jgi:hypothetical protein
MMAMMVVVMLLVKNDRKLPIPAGAGADADADAGAAKDASPPPDADPKVLADQRADEYFRAIDGFFDRGELVRARRALDQVIEEQPVRRQDPRWRERRERFDQAAGALPAGGWRNTTWGMSQAQVRKLYPGGVGGERVLDAEIAFFARRTRAVFRFQDDRLASVELAVPLVRGQIDELLELLDDKYGERATRAGDPNVLRWETPTTRVELKGARFTRPVLRYDSQTIDWVAGESELPRENKLRDL